MAADPRSNLHQSWCRGSMRCGGVSGPITLWRQIGASSETQTIPQPLPSWHPFAKEIA